MDANGSHIHTGHHTPDTIAPHTQNWVCQTNDNKDDTDEIGEKNTFSHRKIS